MNLPYEIMHEPWLAGRTFPEATSQGILCIALPEHVSRVIAVAIGDELPRIACRADGWKVYLLPSVGVTSQQDGPVTEDVVLAVYDARGRHTRLTVRIRDGLPRPSNSDVAPPLKQVNGPWQAASMQTAGLIDHHIDLMNGLFDDPQPLMAGEWQGQASGLGLRPGRVCIEQWRKAGDRDEPRMALIVGLERDRMFRTALESVCTTPRVVLARRRCMQGVGHVQEVDPACIRWIVRQPGITVAQKAGRRQEVMGVARYESADTQENRVVRDLLRRAIRASNRYILQNHRFSGHERVARVRRFRQQLLSMLKASALASVPGMTGVPVPNYVLQHDRRYKPLWGVYLRLIRHDNAQDSAWRWQKRVWAEHITMAITSSIQHIAPGWAWKYDLAIRPEQWLGTYLDTSTPAGPWHSARSTIEIVPAEAFSDHPQVPALVAQLGADIAVVIYEGGDRSRRRVLAVWAVYDFDMFGDRLPNRVRSLAAALAERNHQDDVLWSDVAGLILQPQLESSAEAPPQSSLIHGPCEGMRLQLQTQLDQDRLSHALARGLQIGAEEGAGDAV